MTDSPQTTRSLSDRLAEVQVGPRSELEVSRHLFGGEPCYVVRDPVTFHSHKLSREDYQVFAALKADQPLHSILARLIEQGTVSSDQTEDFYRFIVHLSQLGLLHLPVNDGKSLFARFQQRRAAERKAKLLSILFLRVPLVQPDEFLDRTIRWVGPIFSRWAFAAWLACILLSGFLVASRWSEFHSPVGTMLAAHNLPLLWALLVGLKVIHEFGHAYACKRFGGSVTEMGAYFILFTPCAYIDASAALGFTRPLHRIIVSLAGMYFESMAAMVALLVWGLTGPGLLHSAAQYAVILSTIVTIGFNINPLMKYDGYYVVSDLLGRPNLRAEAQAHVRAELKRLLLGIHTPGFPSSWSSRALLASFGIAAAAYRVLVLLGIGMVIAVKVPIVGLAMAGIYLAGTAWRLVASLLRYVWKSPEVESTRPRALLALSAVSATAICALMLIPWPGSGRALGTIARDNDMIVHARASGFLTESAIEVGAWVEEGALLARLENIDLTTAMQKKRASIDQLRVQLKQELSTDRRAASTTQQNLIMAQTDRQQLLNDQRDLQIRTPIHGQITRADGLRDVGRFIKEGDPLAVVSSGAWNLKAIANAQSLATLMPRVGQQVQLRPVGQGSRVLAGRIARVAMAGSRTIKQSSLTHLAGGEIAVSVDSMEAEEPFFEIDIVIADQDAPGLRHGMTAVVSLGGHRDSIVAHLYRCGLLFLNKLRLAS